MYECSLWSIRKLVQHQSIKEYYYVVDVSKKWQQVKFIETDR